MHRRCTRCAVYFLRGGHLRNDRLSQFRFSLPTISPVRSPRRFRIIGSAQRFFSRTRVVLRLRVFSRMIESIIGRVRHWVRHLPKGWLVAGASALGLVVIVGSVGMYRAYDYVQHDNNFCTSCHLMNGPFVRFEKSAHRGLSCKACHRPNMWQRSQMALTQILEQPDSITHHAEVPSEVCSECHVQGNPEEWKQIAKSAGHRVHLESTNPNLKDIECVECHSSGIHEFSAADKTCGQNGCHENVKVQLGKMGNLTIHCASCHDFSKPVASQVRGDTLRKQLTPRGADCLSCHAMRDRMGTDLPTDEPHGGVCGSCHNPHEQKTPKEAVRSCVGGGCHERVDTVSPMHRRLASGVMQDCTRCHQAHSWKPGGKECTSCHSAEQLDSGTRLPIMHIKTKVAPMSIIDAGLVPLFVIKFVLAQSAQITPPFKHTPHKSVTCLTCHATDDGHGVVKIKTAADCAGCHHSQANAQRCTACHTSNKLNGTFKRNVAFKIAGAKTAVTRKLDFEHARHKMACTSCHKQSTRMRVVASCNSCHESHHTERRNCTSCHTTTQPIKAHTRQVHATCAGSGCHQQVVKAGLRTQRNVCLTCHTDKVKHEPGGDCASCHMIPNQKKIARAAQ